MSLESCEMDRMAFYPSLRLYFFVLISFLVVDLTWLGVVARDFYRVQLGGYLAARVNGLAAILFYLLFSAGLLVFVVMPSLQAGSASKALQLGAFFGLVTYAAYDLTNLATIKHWPLLLTLVDLAWGVVLSTLVSGFGFVVGRWFG